MGALELATFPNPAGLQARGRGLFVATEASGAAAIGQPGQEGRGDLLTGALEQSNVDITDEMVTMIEAQRAYQMAMKAVQAYLEMIEEANAIERR